MSKLIIWGAGDRAKTCLKRGYFDSHTVVAIVDSYLYGLTIEDKYVVIKPDDGLIAMEFDYVVICNQFYQEIVTQLLQLNISLDKIIITDNVKEKPYNNLFLKGKTIIPDIYRMNYEVLKHTTKANERDIYDGETIYSDSAYVNIEYEFDYPRYRTFEFVAEEINSRNISGEVAEFGVFRGVFSSVINRTFPNRKLFLFDTFDGFDDLEAKKEFELGNCSDTFIESHKKTSVEQMLDNLPYPNQAIVCKGFFPESITSEAMESKYAFVSIDVDFEKSTFEGLKFFYPRLSEGGYIFIHDYNTAHLKGVKRAVKEYEEYLGKKLKMVPIADRAGTLIIIK